MSNPIEPIDEIVDSLPSIVMGKIEPSPSCKTCSFGLEDDCVWSNLVVFILSYFLTSFSEQHGMYERLNIISLLWLTVRGPAVFLFLVLVFDFVSIVCGIAMQKETYTYLN